MEAACCSASTDPQPEHCTLTVPGRAVVLALHAAQTTLSVAEALPPPLPDVVPGSPEAEALAGELADAGAAAAPLALLSASASAAAGSCCRPQEKRPPNIAATGRGAAKLVPAPT
mmetsp:Transcript_117397/g.367000  ORF Transcript_117397/g.367000 Transcript_117397/m.367000 type:complete len:115 (-) Transcript_117397:8-352(-)